MLNKANLDKLINHIKKTPEENFDMTSWASLPMALWDRDAHSVINQMETIGGCGTTACLAGHAALLAAAEQHMTIQYVRYSSIESEAATWLGLNIEQYNELFFNMDSSLTPKQTIPVLEYLRDTGKVDWELAYQD